MADETTTKTAGNRVVQLDRRKQAQESALQPQDFARSVYCLSVDRGVSLEEVLKPDFWAHVAYRLKPSDRIDVYTEDSSYYAELLVVGTNRTNASVVVIHKIDLAKSVRTIGVPVDSASQYEVVWGTPATKYQVIRKADGFVFSNGHADANAAWASLHKSLAERERFV